MGFFKRQGLAAEVIVPPGIQGTQALIAGELQFYLGGVDSAALAASRGSDLVALATAEPIEYKLIVQPGIKTVKDLKGKKAVVRSEEHTSELQSLTNLVCRLLLEKKKSSTIIPPILDSNKSNLERSIALLSNFALLRSAVQPRTAHPAVRRRAARH